MSCLCCYLLCFVCYDTQSRLVVCKLLSSITCAKFCSIITLQDTSGSWMNLHVCVLWVSNGPNVSCICVWIARHWTAKATCRTFVQLVFTWLMLQIISVGDWTSDDVWSFEYSKSLFSAVLCLWPGVYVDACVKWFAFDDSFSNKNCWTFTNGFLLAVTHW